ncbi:MAG: universal stress protein [Bacteroidia bacterium]
MEPWISIVGVKKRTGLDKVIFGDVCTTLIGKIKSPLFVVPLNYKVYKTDTVVYAWDGKSTELLQLKPLKQMLQTKNSSMIALNVSHYDENVAKNAPKFKFSLKKMFGDQNTDLIQIQGLDQETEFEKAVKKSILIF